MLVSKCSFRSQCPCGNKVRVKCSQIRLDKMVIASKVEVPSNVRGSGKEKKKRPPSGPYSLTVLSDLPRQSAKSPGQVSTLAKYAVKCNETVDNAFQREI